MLVSYYDKFSITLQKNAHLFSGKRLIDKYDKFSTNMINLAQILQTCSLLGQSITTAFKTRHVFN